MMKRVLIIMLALLICMGSAMGEMKGPRGGDQAKEPCRNYSYIMLV